MRTLSRVFTVLVAALLAFGSLTGCISSNNDTIRGPFDSQVEDRFAYAFLFLEAATPVGIAYGGGVCIENNEEGCVILTASHVCVEGPIKATTLTGNSMTTRVIDFAPHLDLCLMQGTAPAPRAINRIAVNVPGGTSVTNISTPLGMFQPEPNPRIWRFEGETVNMTEDYGKIIDLAIFVNMRASSGMSGSVIFDDEGHIVGLISMTNIIAPYQIMIAASGEGIVSFLHKNGFDLYRDFRVTDRAL